MRRTDAETLIAKSRAKVCAVSVLQSGEYGRAIGVREFKKLLATCKTKQERLNICYEALAQEGYMGGESDDPTIKAWREARRHAASLQDKAA